MKTIKILLVLLLTAMSSIAYGQKIKVAIVDLRPGVNRTQSQIDGLEDMLIAELFNSGKFTVVSRAQVDKVIREQRFQNSNLSSAQKQRIGGILGVDAIITGTINYIIRDRRYASDYSSKVDMGEYNVDLQLINVRTGEIAAAAGDEQGGSTERQLMSRIARRLANNLDMSSFEASRPKPAPRQTRAPYFDKTSHNFGTVQILSGSVKTRFCLKNYSGSTVYIQDVSKTSSALSVDYSTSGISDDSEGCITVTFNPNGRQGSSFKNSIIVTLSDGQKITLYVQGRVE